MSENGKSENSENEEEVELNSAWEEETNNTKCSVLTATMDRWYGNLETRLTCHTKNNPEKIKIAVKDELWNIIMTTDKNVLELKLDKVWVYEATCYADYYTTQRCKHILTVKDESEKEKEKETTENIPNLVENFVQELPKTGIWLYERVRNQMIRFLRK